MWHTSLSEIHNLKINARHPLQEGKLARAQDRCDVRVHAPGVPVQVGLARTVPGAGGFQVAPEAFHGAGKLPAKTLAVEGTGRGPYVLYFLEHIAMIVRNTHLLVGA